MLHITNEVNIGGFLNILQASKNNKVDSFTYAASSSTYGDHEALPKVEDFIGKPLSPYAVTKYVNELYADVFKTNYDFNSIGLRYFNVFGKRQDPNGAYAAVIPKWISAMIAGEEIFINGDGSTSRGFCYIENAVQANILAAVTKKKNALNQVYNVAVGDRTSLNELYRLLQKFFKINAGIEHNKCTYKDFRDGDVRHSQADISKASQLLGYKPTHNIEDGLKNTVLSYIHKSRN